MDLTSQKNDKSSICFINELIIAATSNKPNEKKKEIKINKYK